MSVLRAIYAEAADRIEQLGMRKLYYEIELPLLRVLAEDGSGGLCGRAGCAACLR